RVVTGDGPPVLRAGDVRDHTGDLAAVIAHHGHRDLPGLGVTVAGIGVVHDVGHRGGVAQIGCAVLARDDLPGSIGVPVAVIGQTDVVPGQGVPQHVHSIQAEVDASDDQLCQRGPPPGGQQVLDHAGGSLQDLGDVAAQSGDVVGYPLPACLAGAYQGIEALSYSLAQPSDSIPARFCQCHCSL